MNIRNKILAVSAIGEITLRKIKDPSYLCVCGFSAILGYLVSGAGKITFSQDNFVLYNILTSKGDTQMLTGFLLLLAATLILAVFVGATEIPRDIESKLISILLAKPLTRTEYIIGKYLGVLGICLAFYGTGAVSLLLSNYILLGKLLDFDIILKQLYLVSSLFPFTAMSIMFSCFLKDIGAMITTGVYLFLSVSASTVPMLVALLPRNIGISFYLYCFYYFFPNYIYFLQPFSLMSATGFMLLLYSFSLMGIFLSLGAFHMRFRDIG